MGGVVGGSRGRLRGAPTDDDRGRGPPMLTRRCRVFLGGLALITCAAADAKSETADAAGAADAADAAGGGGLLFEHGGWRCRATRHGIMAFPRRREDLVSKSLDLLGEYSESEARLFRALVRPGDTVLYVGANIGAHAVALAGFVGPAGRVHAFEPGAETASFLRANVALNALDERVLVHQVAVGNGSVHHLTLVTTDGNYGTAYLSEARPPPPPDAHPRGRAQGAEAEGSGSGRGLSSVRVVGLDDFAALAGLEGLRLVKIDVEGHDLQVLQGARRLITSLRPFLCIEMHTEAAGVRAYFESLCPGGSGNPAEACPGVQLRGLDGLAHAALRYYVCV